MNKKFIDETFKKFLQIKETPISIWSSALASLSSINDIHFDWENINRIVNATKSHSIKGIDFVEKLPGELENFGNAAVEAYLRGGDKLGKHWSHIKSQKNSPELSSDPKNAILEDGTVNVSRQANDMTQLERLEASLDNHFDGFKTVYATSEFWERTLGNAFEAGTYAMALLALDKVLINRETLINGNDEDRKKLIIEILQSSGLLAAGTLPISIFLGICLMLIPGLATILGPIGLLGTTGIGIRLIKSVTDNPTHQEKNAISNLREFLKDKLYEFNKFKEGTR